MPYGFGPMQQPERKSALGPAMEPRVAFPARPSNNGCVDLYQEIVALRQQGRRAAIATVTRVRGSAPSFTAAKMLVRDDGSISGTVGGGRVEADVRDAAMDVMQQEKPRTLTFDLSQNPGDEPGLICGGAVEVFIEPIIPPASLYIFGAGHVAQHVSTIAQLAGFAITIVDDRPEFASRQRYPDALQVFAEDLATATPKLPLDAASYIVIVTRSHAEDKRALRWALGTPARYVGMIGSQRKVTAVFGELEKDGISADQLERVFAPIGLDIGAVTPEEIAVSIVAQLVAIRRNAVPSVPSKAARRMQVPSREESTTEKTPL